MSLTLTRTSQFVPTDDSAKQIIYDRETHDFAAYHQNELVGYFKTQLEAELELNRLHTAWLQQQVPSLWQHLDAAPALLAAVQAVDMLRANQGLVRLNNADALKQRTALLAILNTDLQPLGYAPSGDAERPWRDPPLRILSLRGSVTARIAECITSRAIDSGVAQTITPTAVEILWETLIAPHDTIAPTVKAGLIAFALANLPGPAWTIETATNHLVRTLPAWPVRIAMTAEPQTAFFGPKSNRVACHAWCVDDPIVPDGRKPTASDPWRLVWASFGGSHAHLKQLSAYLKLPSRAKKPTMLTLPLTQSRVLHATRWAADGQPYVHHATPVGSGMHLHLVVEPTTLLTPVGNEIFYHVTGPDGVPDWNLLWFQLDRVLALPFQRADLPAIWEAALAEGLVARLKSHGCQGYRINPTQPARWAEVIGTAIGTRCTITMLGTPTATATVFDDDEPVDDEDDL